MFYLRLGTLSRLVLAVRILSKTPRKTITQARKTAFDSAHNHRLR